MITAPDKNLGFVSAAAVIQYLKMAEACGITNIDRALLRSNIDKRLLSNQRCRFSGSALQQLLCELIPQSRDPLFGLHTSQYIQPSSYSVLGYIAMNCATIAEALAKIPIYEKIVGDMGVTKFHYDNKQTFIQWVCCFPDAQIKRHVVDNVLSSWVQFSRWLSGTDVAPAEVWLEHHPEDRHLAEYRNLFSCEIKCDQHRSGLLVDNESLQIPVKQADNTLLNTLLLHASELLAEVDRNQHLSYRVKNQLRLLLQNQVPRKKTVAQQLNMSERTLQRRLQDENTSYQEIFDTIRKELAFHYLHDTNLSIERIAKQLGFKEVRSFHRSFKQWAGLSPGESRNQNRLARARP